MIESELILEDFDIDTLANELLRRWRLCEVVEAIRRQVQAQAAYIKTTRPKDSKAYTRAANKLSILAGDVATLPGE